MVFPEAPRLGVLDGTHLCLIPTCDFPVKPGQKLVVASIPIRSIPLWLHRRTSLRAWSELQAIKHSQGKNYAGRKRSRSQENESFCESDLCEIVELPLPNPLIWEENKPHDKHSKTPTRHILQSLRVGIDQLIHAPHHGKLTVKCAENRTLDFLYEGKLGIYERSSFQLLDNGGYWIADFGGVGGYEQVLVLPRLEIDEEIEWNIENGKSLLRDILSHSVLTDGIHALLPKQGQLNFNEKSNQQGRTQRGAAASPSFTLAKVTFLCSHSIATSVNMPLPKYDKWNETKLKMTRVDGSIDVSSSCWANTMEKALKSRLREERRKCEEEIQSRRLQRHILRKSRQAVYDAVQLQSSESNDLHLLRLRYRTRPVTSTNENNKGLCFAMYIEVDIGFAYKQSTPSKVSEIKSETDMAIHDFQLSVAPASRDGPSKEHVIVRTESGIVPTLSRGDCVTVTLIVKAKGIAVSLNDPKEPEVGLNISIQAFWRKDSSQTLTTRRQERRHGTNFALFDLPLQSLLLSEPPGTYHEIDLSVTKLGKSWIPIKPTAIFDCRKPHVLIVDLSNTTCNWSDFISRINDRLQSTWNRIDWSHDGKSSIANLAIFACNWHEISGLIQLVRRYMPDNAHLLDSRKSH